jgi:hypothetical protein
MQCTSVLENGHYALQFRIYQNQRLKRKRKIRKYLIVTEWCLFPGEGFLLLHG